MPSPEVAAWLQLAVLVVGVASVLVKIGGRDASLRQHGSDIRDLSQIVKDLVRSQVESEVRHEHIRETMDELRKRLDRLEAPRWSQSSQIKDP